MTTIPARILVAVSLLAASPLTVSQAAVSALAVSALAVSQAAVSPLAVSTHTVSQAAVSAIAVSALAVHVGEQAGPLALADQYEHAWQLSDWRGSVVLLIDGDREGSKFNGAWGRAARARYKTEIKIGFVAHLSSVPFFMHGFVRSKFVSNDPAHPNGPVLLDWSGAIGKRFGFRDNESNVYVIDREGVLRYVASGQALNAETDALFHVLDGLLAAPP